MHAIDAPRRLSIDARTCPTAASSSKRTGVGRHSAGAQSAPRLRTWAEVGQLRQNFEKLRDDTFARARILAAFKPAATAQPRRPMPGGFVMTALRISEILSVLKNQKSRSLGRVSAVGTTPQSCERGIKEFEPLVGTVDCPGRAYAFEQIWVRANLAPQLAPPSLHDNSVISSKWREPPITT